RQTATLQQNDWPSLAASGDNLRPCRHHLARRYQERRLVTQDPRLATSRRIGCSVAV
ncbi:hypothetical protein A2U01_0109533, partial [Trifolium medium]|nr:hypothetical protein [Trifolium medium]